MLAVTESWGRRMDEYHNVFELVPCLITIKDRNYVLLRARSRITSHFDGPIHHAWRRCSSVKWPAIRPRRALPCAGLALWERGEVRV